MQETRVWSLVREDTTCHMAKQKKKSKNINNNRTSLVVQWLRSHVSVQATWIWTLVEGNSTCCGATKPACHNYWAHAHNYWSLCSGARAPRGSSPHSSQLGKAWVHNKDPGQPKIKNNNGLFKKRKKIDEKLSPGKVSFLKRKEKEDNKKSWWGCRAIGALMHY